MNKRNRKTKILIIFGGLFLIAVFGATIAFALFAGLSNSNSPQSIYPRALPTTIPSPTLSPVSWLSYTNKTFGYSLWYPSTWKIDGSKAESPMDKSAPFCYYGNTLTLTSPGNEGVLTVSFGPTCLGGQPVPLSKLTQITIDGVTSDKTYVSPGSCLHNLTDQCKNYFSAIFYNAHDCQKSGITDVDYSVACSELKLHGQTMDISFQVKANVSGKNINDAALRIDSPDVRQWDDQLDKIIESIRVPRIALHPEIERP